MKLLRVQPISISLLLLMLMSCKRESTVEELDFGYDYLPLQTGSWIEYSVDSVVFDEFNASVDTFTFTLREECIEIIPDLEGRAAYVFERSKQFSDTSGFRYDQTFTRLIDGVRAEELRENLRTVILTFPPNVETEWNSNAFNTKETRQFSYESVHEASQFNDLMFDSTIRVIQLADTDNFILKRYAEEQYAKHVGLVFKEYFQIETQFDVDSGLHWIQKVERYGVAQ